MLSVHGERGASRRLSFFRACASGKEAYSFIQEVRPQQYLNAPSWHGARGGIEGNPRMCSRFDTISQAHREKREVTIIEPGASPLTGMVEAIDPAAKTATIRGGERRFSFQGGPDALHLKVTLAPLPDAVAPA